MTTIFVPDDFYCPITGELMNDPVSEPAGHTYEKSAITKWLSKNNTSPMTRNGLNINLLNQIFHLKKVLILLKINYQKNNLKLNLNY